MTRKPHGNIIKAADKDLSEGVITEQSHAAVLAENMTLQDARNIGADPAPTDAPEDHSGPRTATETPRSASAQGHHDMPPQPISRVSKSDRSRPCMACGEMTSGSLFHQGCDMKMHRLAREYVRGERDLTDEQLEYVRESGKLERAKARVEKEREKEQRKAERAAARESRKAKK
jgi:hypothetical protein